LAEQILHKWAAVETRFIKVRSFVILLTHLYRAYQVFPKEYKRALEDLAREERDGFQLSLDMEGHELAKDIKEGEEGYSEDIMQDTPAHAMDQVGVGHCSESAGV
jgi:hypothetical protein